MRKYIFLVMIIAAVFAAVSCTTKGDAGIAGADGSNVASALFQNGVAPSSGYGGCEDATIESDFPSLNMGGCSYLLTGKVSVAIYKSLIKFDISYISPKDVDVKTAKLTLYFDNTDDIDGSNTYTAYAVTKNWTEGTGACGGAGDADVNASWNYYDGSVNSWDTAGGDYGAAAMSDSVFISSVSDGSSIVFNLNADMVESWIEEPHNNYGIIIVGAALSGTHWLRPCSSDYASGNYYRPRLEIDYALPQ